MARGAVITLQARAVYEPASRNPALRALQALPDAIDAAVGGEAFFGAVQQVVAAEYAQQFASQGAYFGEPWRSEVYGHDLTLRETDKFKDSFNPGTSDWQVATNKGRRGYTYTVHNTHRRGRLNKSMVAFFESGGARASLRTQIVGPIGGVSQAGADAIGDLLAQYSVAAARAAGWKGA